ncbi:MAG: hypothetical protein NC213_08010 [Acetobacter sp.]|nr:hypothetical protein [Bacteroides sp.]MCM1341673.1 hypothetical protein [Acetobacter sp.]MCM1434278.1 hypothetical protein [Clostridiales bacterium]
MSKSKTQRKAGEEMKIEGTPKEIADFVLQLQNQHKLNTFISDADRFLERSKKNCKKPLLI